MSTLDNLRKSAKRWLKALRSGDAAALERLRRAYPEASPNPVLRDVQHALAREEGLASWPALKAHADERAAAAEREAAERAATFLRSACWDHHVHGARDHRQLDRAAQRLLAQHPEIAVASIHTATVCGNLTEVQRLLADRPEAARQRGGPRDWTPILTLCYTRFTHAPTHGNAVAIARLLLDHGANPNDFYMAGGVPYTALVGAAGEGEQDAPRQPFAGDLFDLLLERGAEPFDAQVLYNTHFHGELLWWLTLVHKHTVNTPRAAAWADPDWRMFDMGAYGSGARFILETALKQRKAELAAWALAHGANPNAGPARDHRFPKVTLYQLARRLGASDVAELLLRHGASPVEAPPLTEHEKIHALFTAAGQDRADALAVELERGVPPDMADVHGSRLLHHAAFGNALAVARLLVERGAQIDPRDGRFNATPLGWASHADHADMVAFLAPLSRDFRMLCFTGSAARVRELLAEDPTLARQTDAEGATPLWYLPDDEATAMAVVDALLAAGADPSVARNDGETAAGAAKRRGLVEVARRLEACA